MLVLYSTGERCCKRNLAVAEKPIQILKKTGMDADELKNYRPISNLTFMSKLVERAVASRLTSYLNEHALMPQLQSAYRRHHSTETALLKVLSDIYATIDRRQVTLLALLDPVSYTHLTLPTIYSV